MVCLFIILFFPHGLQLHSSIKAIPLKQSTYMSQEHLHQIHKLGCRYSLVFVTRHTDSDPEIQMDQLYLNFNLQILRYVVWAIFSMFFVPTVRGTQRRQALPLLPTGVSCVPPGSVPELQEPTGAQLCLWPG